MASVSFVLKFFITGDSLAIAGSTLTVFYTFHQITVARHLQKELRKDNSNRNTLEESRVSNTVNRFQPGQILAANLLILHAALWAIVRSTLHLTFTTGIKEVRNPHPDPERFYLYPMQRNMNRSDRKHLWGVVQTFTWGTLLFTAIPMLWMVRQFFPKVFLPRARTLSLLWNMVLVCVFFILWMVNSFGTTASHGVSLAMLAWVNLIMVSLLSSMLEIQRHATRAKVQGREVKILKRFVRGLVGFLVAGIVFVTSICSITALILFNPNAGASASALADVYADVYDKPGLTLTWLVTMGWDDLLGFPLEISAVQFFQLWWLLTMKRLARCPIDEWTMGQEDVCQDGPEPTKGVLAGFGNFWRFLVYEHPQRYLHVTTAET